MPRRDNTAQRIELIVLVLAIAAAFVAAFVRDPGLASERFHPLGLQLANGVGAAFVAFVCASLVNRLSPAGQWLGAAGFALVLAAGVGATYLRPAVARAGLYPPTRQAVVDEVGDLSGRAQPQVDAFVAAVREGRAVPALSPLAGRDEVTGYFNAVLLTLRDIAAEQSAFRRECDPTPFESRAAFLQRAHTPAGMAAARRSVEDCQRAAVRHRDLTMKRIDALPAPGPVFLKAGLSQWRQDDQGKLQLVRRADIERSWNLQLQILSLRDQQLEILAHTRWTSNPDDDVVTFYDRAALNRFAALDDRLRDAVAEHARLAAGHHYGANRFNSSDGTDYP